MGAEKGGTKAGGFFHLFDWNRKSRKKLFSNGTASLESSKKEKRSDDNLPSTRLRLDDEDETVGVSSVKGSSDYSCASSVTDEGFTIRPPGVVARLMGLESMPVSDASEPSSTPFFDSRFLREKQSHKRSPEFCVNDRFTNISRRTESCTRKPMELKSQKMPSSPIERFQTETIPLRSAKPLPLAHHRLLSPIKNPGFVSGKNAAHIMEAAAKILDPGPQPSTRGKVSSSFGSSSIPLKVCDSKESMMATQSRRTTRILESARMPADVTVKLVNRCSNGPEDNAIFRRTPNFVDPSSADAKGKGKSISLAIQAKVNVQRRGGLSSSSRNASVQRDHEESKVNPSFRSQPNDEKNNKQERKAATANASGVLRQNNQKQNCVSNKSKLPPKQSVNNQHGRKIFSGGGGTSMKNKTINKISDNSRVHRKEGLETTNLERDEHLSMNRGFPRKKRLIERDFLPEKDGDRRQKHVQSNVARDEHSYLRWAEDSRSDGTDVVSFTFTSPIIKQMPIMPASSTQVVEKWDKRNIICYDSLNPRDDSVMQDKRTPSQSLNAIKGDALSVLLEQKLRELTSGVGTSNCGFQKVDGFTASSSDTQELESDFNAYSTSTAEKERKLMHKPWRDNHVGAFHPGVSSTNGLMLGLNKLQGAEVVECSSSSDVNETDFQHRSPLSTLESSSSNGSIISTDSSGSSKESKVCSSSIQAKNTTSFSSVNKNPSPEAEMELSDSASSTLTETSDVSELIRSRPRANYDNLDYVREVSSLVCLENHETLDQLDFDNLEREKSRKDEDEFKGGKMWRKVLFDCVNECLDSKFDRYFRVGYNSWSKGVGVIGKNLTEDIYEEISMWKNMEDWALDELVNKDMSTHRGRWVDYEIEAFEAGREIANEIVSYLVDGIIADFLN